jgi:predicted nucleic acid-binding Zn ribbon protein
MKKDKKNNGVEHIGAVIQNVLKTYQCESDGHLAQVWHLWNSTVGETIAANAQPEAFKGRILLVNVTSSVWLQQLRFLKENIINNINDALGETFVEEIKFKIGPV